MKHTVVLVSALAFASCATSHEVARQADVCPVHHIHMERKMVWVSYGYIVPDDSYVAAMNRAFPYGDEFASGGCDPSAGPRKAPVYVCPECKRARYKWAQRHPKNPEAQSIL
jgi:hypothetical protein